MIKMVNKCSVCDSELKIVHGEIPRNISLFGFLNIEIEPLLLSRLGEWAVKVFPPGSKVEIEYCEKCGFFKGRPIQ
jgi:hypothetical protein